MGTGLARRLTQHGITVLTDLNGRSGASRERALSAGMTPVQRTDLLDADMLLSVLPPAQALSFAAEIAALSARATRKPIFVDCNAISPATVAAIADTLAPSETPFVDVGIIGLPPAGDGPGPRLYASGGSADKIKTLARYGLDVRVLDGPVGMASALKMAYAGITKGLIFVASAMLLAAARGGVSQALAQELAASEPQLFTSLGRRIPDMLPKAYRWVAEMDEISRFVEPDPAASALYHAAASFYQRMAADAAGLRSESKSLESYFHA
jgi:putative dehydrogenase